MSSNIERKTGSRLYKYLTSLVFTFLLMVVFTGSLQAGMTCEYCKKPITEGRYVQVDGKYYHADHFLCGRCGRKIGTSKYFHIDGKYVCENCYNRYYRPVCEYCRRPITDVFVEVDGKKYHQRCYNDHVALKCAICKRPIEGNYITDFWGNSYCRKHQDELHQCDYCGRLISKRTTGGGRTYPDGRHICGYCLQDVIKDRRTAERVMKDVIMYLGLKGITVENKGISLSLVDKPELADITGDRNGNHTGFVKYEGQSLLGKITKAKYDIYILDGMPRIDFIESVAHELMHVWQYSRGLLDQSPAWSEGSCNYASALVLGYFHGKRSDYNLQNLELNPDPIYGEGYRRVKRLVASRGVNGWLEALQKNRFFPSGY